jgi:general secretion pathway protein J
MKRGFTLLEVMVAMSVVAVLSVTLFYAFAGLSRTRGILEENADIHTMGRVAMLRIQREVSLAFLTSLRIPTGSYETRFFGEDSDPVDLLSFTSLSHERIVRDAQESDQTEISYFEESDPESGYLMLMHREAPRIDDDMETGGVVLPLSRRVKSLNFRYFDEQKRKWLDDWDSDALDQASRLPFMVSIELVLVDTEGEEHPFRSRVFVRHSKPLGKYNAGSSGGSASAGSRGNRASPMTNRRPGNPATMGGSAGRPQQRAPSGRPGLGK